MSNRKPVPQSMPPMPPAMAAPPPVPVEEPVSEAASLAAPLAEEPVVAEAASEESVEVKKEKGMSIPFAGDRPNHSERIVKAPAGKIKVYASRPLFYKNRRLTADDKPFEIESMDQLSDAMNLCDPVAERKRRAAQKAAKLAKQKEMQEKAGK